MTIESDALPIELEDRELSSLSPDEVETIQSGYAPESDDTPLPIAVAERRVITQPYDFNVGTIVDQIDDKSLVVRPQYQRGYVWDDNRASRLIESLLLNIPIPTCYFAEEDSGVFTVIDGQQRLYSIWRFTHNEFKLRKLNTLGELNGKAFSELPAREQRLIKGRFIRCIVITQESHPEIRFEVFERLNTGSMQLTDQEIRNAVYRGAFNELLRTLAEQPRWLKALAKKQLDGRMRDDELVLRLFAVHDNYVNYDAPLRKFLNDYMQSKRGKNGALDAHEQQRLQRLFEETVDKVTAVFGTHAFRIHSRGKWERILNRALFDAVMLVFSKLPHEALVNKREQINAALIALCKDEDFLRSITRSTADRRNFVERVGKFSKTMADIGLDSGIHQTLSQ